MEPVSKNALTVPMAIVVAGIIVGGAIFLSKAGDAPRPEKTADMKASANSAQTVSLAIRPVNEADHIRGNPNAPIMLVEFSDTECPFCKAFHSTLTELMDQYGKSGQLAWAYRYFPLPQLHPKAPKEAEALECAAAQGGNDKFWAYTDEIFRITPSNNGLDAEKLPQIASDIGLDTAKFKTCLSSGVNQTRVQTDYKEAVEAGGSGTPYTVVLLQQPLSTLAEQQIRAVNSQFNQPPGSPDIIGVGTDKKEVSIGGALPFQTMKQVVEILLK